MSAPVEPVSKVTILGGGTAGWMAAAALARQFEGRRLELRLVESDHIGTVGVGEATVPSIAAFNRFLGLNERDFMRATGATFKVGIEFNDWLHCGHRFFHPFAGYGMPIQGQDFYQCWLRLWHEGVAPPLEEFCLATQLARHGRFVQPDSAAHASPLVWFNYAYHFDATRYAGLLRNYAEARGVVRTQGKVVQVEQHADTGFITALHLESGERVGGQLFLDCSGFRGLLLNQTLKVRYRDWSSWLPCDSALAVQTINSEPPAPYTCATARDAGWQWKIPLQHRAGNGYVFSSACSSRAAAEDSLLQHLDGQPLTSPRLINFTAGMREVFWAKNCVALGLASGFIEPLESTSISLIQTGIGKLLQFFPASDFSAALRDEANRLNEQEYTHLRDFIILHYHSTRRNDTELWRYVRQMRLPDSLQERMAAFKRDGTVSLREQETFETASWLSIYTGMGIVPDDCASAVKELDAALLLRGLQQMRASIFAAVPHAPRHEDFLRQLM